MNAKQRSTACLWLAIAVLLPACQASMPPSIKPTPPLVTDCLVVPSGRYTAVPAMPATLTDAWAVRMWAWANRTLGTATADRTQWQGERDCVRAKAATGAIR